MASFEDYDEFGNYIGGDLDSDEEEEELQQQSQFAPQPEVQPLEGFDEEPAQDDMALMEVDGTFARYQCVLIVVEGLRRADPKCGRTTRGQEVLSVGV